MRTGLVIYGSLDTLSGGYLYDRKLVETLRLAGHEVEILSLPWRNYARHLSDNLKPGLARRIAGLNVDMLLQDELNHPSLVDVNRRLRACSNTPIISIVHHLRCHESHPAALRPIYREVERRYLHTVDGYIFNSNTTKTAVSELTRCQKPSVVAVPAANHLNPPDDEFVRERIRRRCKEAGPLRVLAVGNVIQRKGIHELVHALTQLPIGVCVLEVIGSLDVAPAYVKHLRHAVQCNGLQSVVNFHGRVNTADLKAALTRAHVLAVPSFEGFGIVYLEAMAYGVPVIASTAGAAHEIVVQGQNGFLTPPGDPVSLATKLQQLASDRSGLLLTMSHAARTRYDQHPTWSTSMGNALSWLCINKSMKMSR